VTNEQLDKLINSFKVSNMNNSKWEKLIDELTNVISNEIYINYKLVTEEEIYSTSFITSDFKPFFAEPILYKEVEWIEFPEKYEEYISKDNRKAGKTIFCQNIIEIYKILNQIGKLDLEKSSCAVRLYAYR